MGRDFDGTDQADCSTSPINAKPFGISVWVKGVIQQDHVILCSAETVSAGTDGALLYLFNSGVGVVNAQVREFDNSSGSPAAATGTVNLLSEAGWVHLFGRIDSDTSRSIFTNGADKQTDTTSRTIGLSHTQMRLGRGVQFSTTIFADCLIAELAIWEGTVPNDSEVAQLAAGVNPQDIAAAGLVAYVPILGSASPELDEINSFDFTITGAADAGDHPAIDPPGGGGGSGLLLQVIQNEG